MKMYETHVVIYYWIDTVVDELEQFLNFSLVKKRCARRERRGLAVLGMI